jgi:hypothetical protein
LYHGTNQRGTNVLTWAAQSDETSFADDVSPLLQYLWQNDFVSADSYIGLIAFGTEGHHANGNVTFTASRCEANVLAGPAPTITIPAIPETPTSTSGPSPADSFPSGAELLHGSWLVSLSISAIVSCLMVSL